jgi:hypothetical protein
MQPLSEFLIKLQQLMISEGSQFDAQSNQIITFPCL